MYYDDPSLPPPVDFDLASPPQMEVTRRGGHPKVVPPNQDEHMDIAELVNVLCKKKATTNGSLNNHNYAKLGVTSMDLVHNEIRTFASKLGSDTEDSGEVVKRSSEATVNGKRVQKLDVHEDIARYANRLNALSGNHSTTLQPPVDEHADESVEMLSSLLNSPAGMSTDDPFSSTFDEILDLEELSMLSSPASLKGASSMDLLLALDDNLELDTVNSPGASEDQKPKSVNNTVNDVLINVTEMKASEPLNGSDQAIVDHADDHPPKSIHVKEGSIICTSYPAASKQKTLDKDQIFAKNENQHSFAAASTDSSTTELNSEKKRGLLEDCGDVPLSYQDNLSVENVFHCDEVKATQVNTYSQNPNTTDIKATSEVRILGNVPEVPNDTSPCVEVAVKDEKNKQTHVCEVSEGHFSSSQNLVHETTQQKSCISVQLIKGSPDIAPPKREASKVLTTKLTPSKPSTSNVSNNTSNVQFSVFPPESISSPLELEKTNASTEKNLNYLVKKSILHQSGSKSVEQKRVLFEAQAVGGSKQSKDNSDLHNTQEKIKPSEIKIVEKACKNYSGDRQQGLGKEVLSNSQQESRSEKIDSAESHIKHSAAKQTISAACSSDQRHSSNFSSLRLKQTFLSIPPPIPPLPEGYDKQEFSIHVPLVEKDFVASSAQAMPGLPRTEFSTFEQRREKELDDILHALQATVQKMEEDCIACDLLQQNTQKSAFQGLDMRRPLHADNFALHTPKPFSLSPDQSQFRPVRFSRKHSTEKVPEKPQATSNADGQNSGNLHSKLAHKGLKEKNETVQDGLAKAELVSEPVIEPLVPATLQNPKRDEMKITNETQLAELADFLRNINIGTKANGSCDQNERSYMDDDMDDYLDELESLERSDLFSHSGKSKGKMNSQKIPVQHENINKVEKPVFKEQPILLESKLNLQESRHTNSITSLVDKPTDDDFVCPPLPPPPTEEDLLEATSTGTRSSSASEISTSTSGPSSIISPTFKASSKFSVWTSSHGVKVNGTEQDFVEKANKNTTGPVGFRSVSRPVSKSSDENILEPSFSSTSLTQFSPLLNSNCNNNKGDCDVSGLHKDFATMDKCQTGLKPDKKPGHKSSATIVLRSSNPQKSQQKIESQRKGISDLEHSTNGSLNITQHINGTSLSPCSSPEYMNHPTTRNSGQIHNQSGHLVTLLRDTRHILIKQEQASEPAKSTVRTSYTLPDGQHLPAPSETVKVTPKDELPEGAVYETHTIEGDLLHTDTYYPAPGGTKVLERTKKTTIIKAEHHHGMGPTDDQGVPVALRSTVENQKAWYKNMFKQIHKFEDEEGNDPNRTGTDDFVEKEPEPVVSQKPYYKPKRLGRITDYTPSEPYVVENKPQKSNADCSIRRKNKMPLPNGSSKPSSSKPAKTRQSSSLEDFVQKEWVGYFDDVNKPKSPKHVWEKEARELQKDRIPPASTSYNPPHRKELPKPERVKPTEEPIHGTDYSAKQDYTMADYVVTEPKQPTNTHHFHNKPASPKGPEVRIPARAKFDFKAKSDKQLTILKDQTVIITREVNKDWYEGESADGKRNGIFPVAYVELLTKTPAKPARRGLAKAKFDFTANSPKQLTIKKGDSVELVEKVDKNWYKAAMGSKSGIIPANYIEVTREPEEVKKKTGSPKSPAQSNTNGKKSTTVISHQQSASSSSSNSEPDDKDKMSRASYLAHAVVNSGANLSHSKPRRGEFDIPELDDAAMGISPRNDSGDVQHSPQGSYETSSSTMSSSLHSDFDKSLHVSPAEASSNKGKSEEFIMRTEEQNNGIDQHDDGMPVMHKHVALYAYSPQNEDELELLGGDIVQVVEMCDDGWFVGTCERTGAFGTFPGNYVIAVD